MGFMLQEGCCTQQGRKGTGVGREGGWGESQSRSKKSGLGWGTALEMHLDIEPAGLPGRLDVECEEERIQG